MGIRLKLMLTTLSAGGWAGMFWALPNDIMITGAFMVAAVPTLIMLAWLWVRG